MTAAAPRRRSDSAAARPWPRPPLLVVRAPVRAGTAAAAAEAAAADVPALSPRSTPPHPLARGTDRTAAAPALLAPKESSDFERSHPFVATPRPVPSPHAARPA